MGVSICLDVISIEISISTSKKSQSRQSRFSRQVLKTGLDCRDKVSIGLDALKSRFLSRSRHQKKVSLDRRENLDKFKKLVSTLRTFSTVQKMKSRHGLCPKVSIFVKVSIEISISTPKKCQSRRDG